MANEILKVDQNNKPVAGFVTDDASQEIRMARIDDTTKGLKVTIVGGVPGTTTEYLITVSGGTYYATNNTTGFSTSNASLDTVWTSVLSDIGSNPATITFGAGTFTTTAGLSLTKSNITVRGQGQGVTTLSADSGSGMDSVPIFKADPTQSATGYSLTSNATVGDLTLTMSSANLISSGIVAGDYIILYSSYSIDTELSSRNQGELHTVVSVNTGTGVITLGAANNGTHVYQTMTTANSAKVAKLTMYQNITIEGISFTDTATSRPSTLTTGQVLFRFVDNLTIKNCYFHDMFNAGLMIWQCMNVKVSQSYFKNIKDVTPTANVFYGIVLRGATINTSITNCNFNNMRHGVTQGAGTTTYYAGTTRNMTVSNCSSISTFTSHFDVHQGAEGVSFINNTMVGDDGSANGIQARSPATITGNSIVGVLGKGISLFGSASGSVVSGNSIKGCTDGVFVDVMVNNVNITGNSIVQGTRGMTLSRSTAAITSISNASPAVITTTAAHGLVPGAQVMFSTTGALPTGLSTGTVYYVVPPSATSPVTSTTFSVSATYNGTPINTSSAGSGTHTLIERGGNDSNITNNYIFSNSSVGIDANGQQRVKVSGNTFKLNSLPFQLANTDSIAGQWVITDNYSNDNTSSNYPTINGTGHTVKDNTGFGGNAIRWLKPNHYAVGTADGTPVAGTVYSALIEVPEDTLVDAIGIVNGTVASGNFRVGIYGPVVTEDTMAGSALVYDSGDIAQSGTNVAQLHTMSSTKLLTKGRYYASLQFDNTTARFVRQGNQTQAVGWVQTYARGGGYGAFTNPAPAMTDTGSNCPVILLRASVVG